MMLPVSPPSPLSVTLSAGIAGPPGPGIASAAVSSGDIVFTCTDGSTLPPLPLGALLMGALQTPLALNTIDGATLTTLDGNPILRSS